jgi:hypothetical protein
MMLEQFLAHYVEPYLLEDIETMKPLRKAERSVTMSQRLDEVLKDYEQQAKHRGRLDALPLATPTGAHGHFFDRASGSTFGAAITSKP